MFSLFKKSQAKIEFIEIPDYNWGVNEESKEVIRWINPEQTVALSVNVFNKVPDIPTIQHKKILCDYYRLQIIAQNGGLIEVSQVKLKGFNAIKTIFKFPQPTGGMMYLGSYTIPFRRASYVIKIQANEVGFTGVREAVITERIGKDNFTQADPYDDTLSGTTLRNKSEEKVYDKEFPEHPLSIVRSMLNDIESETVFSEELRGLKEFDY